MPTFATLCYLRHEGKVLLLRKARGLFGEGKWNAPGGKLLRGENPSTGAVREMYEETGLKVGGLSFYGLLNFFLGEAKELDQTVFVFSAAGFNGDLREGREGMLRWFPIAQIPYGEMWHDDRLWVPLLLDGKSFVGDFYFTENYKEFLSHNIRQANGL